MAAERSKTFQYKKAQPNLAAAIPTLQDLLRSALKKREIVMDRARKLNDDDPTHLVNYNGIHGKAGASGNLLGIEFLSFSEGQNPSALTIDRKAKELPIEQLNLSKEGKETVKGAVYCGIRGNHVIVAQSAALRTIHLELYINWLLMETKLLSGKNYIGLVDFVPTKNRGILAMC